jgi:hypothetical protein
MFNSKTILSVLVSTAMVQPSFAMPKPIHFPTEHQLFPRYGNGSDICDGFDLSTDATARKQTWGATGAGQFLDDWLSKNGEDNWVS